MTAVKICCIQSVAEARMALDAGADAFGLVAQMPSGPGPISDAKIAKIAAAFPNAMSVLLTSRTEAQAICDHIEFCQPRAVQIVDAVSSATHRKIRDRFPDVTLIQVVHVRSTDDITDAIKTSSHVDHLLLDSGAPEKGVKELGGTGRTHDWDFSRQIVDAVSIPVWLAGGLDPDNVRRAIQAVRPYGVDLCSGLRLGGDLDPVLLKRFMEEVRTE